MGWKITPNTGVTIDENSGIAEFSPNTTETPNIYEISYESEEGCGECKKTVIVEPKTCNCSNAEFTITLDESALEVSNEGGTVDVSYSTKCGTVTASCSNATVVVSDGKVTFTIPSNDTHSDKVFNCKIGINGDSSCSESFNIRQKGTERESESCSCKDLRIGGASVVPYSGGTVRISYTVDCEGDFVLGIYDDNDNCTTWPINDADDVIKNDCIELKFGENDSEEKKVYSGIITLNGSDCRTFLVTQNAKVEEEEDECRCIDAELTVSADKTTIDSTSGTVTVSCSVNCGGDMKYKFEDEGEQTVQDGKITLTIPTNETDEPKKYKCQVWVIDESCSKTIYINQNAKDKEEEKECEETDFSIDKEVDEANIAKVTVTGECEFDWKEVCKVTHCCNGEVDKQVSPTSLFEVSSTTVTQGEKCVTTIYAKTVTKNESNITKNGIVDVHISTDGGGSWTLSKWRVPISSENCPPIQDPCDYLSCGDIIINTQSSVYGYEKQDGVQIATYKLGEDCDDETKVTNVTASGGLTITSFADGKILADFPDLSDCGKEPPIVEYTVTVSYKISGSPCPDEVFTISQYQNSYPCPTCTCEEAVEFYYQYNFVHSQDPENNVELIRYNTDCGEVTNVTATVNGVSVCNCSIDGPDELEYNVGTAKYSATTNYSTVDGSITITSWNNGKIVGNFPDLSECGIWTASPITHKVIVDYGDGCRATFDFEQEANTNECCLCEMLLFTPSNSRTYDVTYAEQNVFTITSDQKCSLSFSKPSWIRAVETSSGVYDIYVDNNTSTSDRSGNIEVKSKGDTCITHTINQAGSPPPPPPPTGDGDTVLSEFDFMTFIYRWTSEAGRDLDTATVVLNSGISSLDGSPIGYSCGSSSNEYLRWGGDNTGTGTESACINLSKILSDMAEGTTTITIEFYGNWYGSMGTGAISMEYYTYKGGTMNDPTSSGDLYVNNGGELVYSETRNVTVTVEGHSSCVTSNMFKIGQIVYDVASKTAVFSTY